MKKPNGITEIKSEDKENNNANMKIKKINWMYPQLR